MANEDSVLREVDQELAEERQWAMFREHGPRLIAAALGVVVVVGAWQFWKARQETAAAEGALEFKNAIELLAEDEEQGRAALEAIFDDGSSGYGVLAKLQEAASYLRNGERLAAIEAFRAVAENNAAPKRLRELARLRAGYYSLADGRDAVLANLDGIHEEDSINGYYGKEILALAAMKEKDYETAHALFIGLSTDIGAPATLRERAEEFAALAASGKAGVNITGEARVEDLVKAVGEAAEDVDHSLHDGHSHDDAENAADEGAAGDAANEAGGEPAGESDESDNENE